MTFSVGLGLGLLVNVLAQVMAFALLGGDLRGLIPRARAGSQPDADNS